jgi:hypothetical protein
MTDTSTVTVTGLRHQVTDIPVMTTIALAQRADDAADVGQAADLLYDATDLRAVPWPDAQALGLLRSHLRNFADWLEEEDA